MISLWIHSIHCSRQILLYYLYRNINQLLPRILKQVGHGAGLTVKCPKLRLYNILTQLLICHVNLDKRKFSSSTVSSSTRSAVEKFFYSTN